MILLLSDAERDQMIRTGADAGFVAQFEDQARVGGQA
jgi:hypothetical protein